MANDTLGLKPLRGGMAGHADLGSGGLAKWIQKQVWLNRFGGSPAGPPQHTSNALPVHTPNHPETTKNIR